MASANAGDKGPTASGIARSLATKGCGDDVAARREVSAESVCFSFLEVFHSLKFSLAIQDDRGNVVSRAHALPGDVQKPGGFLDCEAQHPRV